MLKRSQTRSNNSWRAISTSWWIKSACNPVFVNEYRGGRMHIGTPFFKTGIRTPWLKLTLSGCVVVGVSRNSVKSKCKDKKSSIDDFVCSSCRCLTRSDARRMQCLWFASAPSVLCTLNPPADTTCIVQCWWDSPVGPCEYLPTPMFSSSDVLLVSVSSVFLTGQQNAITRVSTSANTHFRKRK